MQLIVDDTKTIATNGGHISTQDMLYVWCLHRSVEVGCVSLTMPLSDVLSGNRLFMCVIP